MFTFQLIYLPVVAAAVGAVFGMVIAIIANAFCVKSRLVIESE